MRVSALISLSAGTSLLVVVVADASSCCVAVPVVEDEDLFVVSERLIARSIPIISDVSTSAMKLRNNVCALSCPSITASACSNIGFVANFNASFRSFSGASVLLLMMDSPILVPNASVSESSDSRSDSLARALIVS